MIGSFAARWTLRARVSMGLLLTAVLLLPVTAMAVVRYRAALVEIRDLAEVGAAQIKTVAEAGTTLANVRASRRRFFRTGEPQFLEQARRGIDEAVAVCKQGLRLSDRARSSFARTGRLLVRYRWTLDESAQVVERLPGTDSERERFLSKLARVEELLRRSAAEPGNQRVGEAVLELTRLEQDLRPGGQRERAVEAQDMVLEQLATAIELELDRIADYAWIELERDRKVAATRSQRGLRNLITALMATSLLLVGLLLWLPSRIAAPLSRLRILARRIGHGEEESVDPSSFPDDETRRLAEGLAQVVARAREMETLQRNRIRLLEMRFRSLLHALDEPVLVLDRQHRILLAARCIESLLGVKPSRLSNHSLDDLLTEEARAALFEPILAGRDDRTEAIVDLGLPEGKSSRVRTFLEVIRDEEGRAVQYLVVLKPVGEKAAAV